MMNPVRRSFFLCTIPRCAVNCVDIIYGLSAVDLRQSETTGYKRQVLDFYEWTKNLSQPRSTSVCGHDHWRKSKPLWIGKNQHCVAVECWPEDSVPRTTTRCVGAVHFNTISRQLIHSVAYNRSDENEKSLAEERLVKRKIGNNVARYHVAQYHRRLQSCSLRSSQLRSALWIIHSSAPQLSMTSFTEIKVSYLASDIKTASQWSPIRW